MVTGAEGRDVLGAGGESLRGLRIAAGFTQEELGARCGLSARTIRNLETGRTVRPRTTTLDDLALALGMSGLARETFRDSWGVPGRGVRLDPGHTASVHRSVLARFRDRLNSFTTTYVCVQAFVDGERFITREMQERVVTADVDGVQTLVMAVDTRALSPDGRTKVVAVSSCRVGRKTSIPSERVDLYEVHLGRKLRRSEAWHYQVCIAYQGPPTIRHEDEAEPSITMFAMHHVDSLAVFKVTFDGAALPARCWSVYEETLGSGLVDGPRVAVTADGHAQHVVHQPALGWHGVRWSW